MKIRSILLTLTFGMAAFIAISAVMQDRLSNRFIEQAGASQVALIRTGALADEVRVLQLDFKWQVQAFKDILLRGRDPDLFEKHRKEYQAYQGKVASEIEKISAQMVSADYAPLADTLKRISDGHKSVSAQYAGAIDIYEHMTSKGGGHGLEADVAVRGIDRELTVDIDSIAAIVHKQNAVNAQAAAEAAARMHGEVASKVYAVAALLILLVVAAGLYALRMVMAVLGAEPDVLRTVAESISNGDLTATIPAHDEGNDSSLASQLLLMQMKMRSLVIGIHEEAKAALERARTGAALEEIVDDMRSLSKSMRRFKTSALEEGR